MIHGAAVPLRGLRSRGWPRPTCRILPNGVCGRPCKFEIDRGIGQSGQIGRTGASTEPLTQRPKEASHESAIEQWGRQYAARSDRSSNDAEAPRRLRAATRVSRLCRRWIPQATTVADATPRARLGRHVARPTFCNEDELPHIGVGVGAALSRSVTPSRSLTGDAGSSPPVVASSSSASRGPSRVRGPTSSDGCAPRASGRGPSGGRRRAAPF